MSLTSNLKPLYLKKKSQYILPFDWTVSSTVLKHEIYFSWVNTPVNELLLGLLSHIMFWQYGRRELSIKLNIRDFFLLREQILRSDRDQIISNVDFKNRKWV